VTPLGNMVAGFERRAGARHRSFGPVLIACGCGNGILMQDSPGDKQAQQARAEAIRALLFGIQAIVRVHAASRRHPTAPLSGLIIAAARPARLEVAEIQARVSLFSELILVDRRR